MPDFGILASTLTSGFLLGGVLALAALGLSIMLGGMGLVNLAHGELLIAGAYLSLFVVQAAGINPLWGLPLVGALLAVGSVPLYRILLQPIAAKGLEASMMTTFGLSVILQNAFLLFFHADTRSIQVEGVADALNVGPIGVGKMYLIGFAISVAVILAVHLLITRSSFGRDLRASTADPVAAAMIGIDVSRVQGWTFALGSACAAIGGTLMGIIFSFSPTVGPSYLLNSFAIIVLGGLGNIFGTLLAGLLLGVLQSLGAMIFGDGYRDLVGLVVFLTVLALRPQGLLARKES